MKLRILCIDDSKSVHAFLKDCVLDVALDFKSVFDGKQGLEFLLKNNSQVDLVFLDWEMPVMTGPEVLTELKKMSIPVPIIMLTSKNETSDIAQVFSKGASEYIMKPFTKDIILQKIKMVFPSES